MIFISQGLWTGAALKFSIQFPRPQAAELAFRECTSTFPNFPPPAQVSLSLYLTSVSPVSLSTPLFHPFIDIVDGRFIATAESTSGPLHAAQPGQLLLPQLHKLHRLLNEPIDVLLGSGSFKVLNIEAQRMYALQLH